MSISFANETVRKRPATLRKLKIDEVSMVPRGANPGARVIIRKHDTGSVMKDALAALDTSIKSIAGDGGLMAKAKAAAMTESLVQYVDYLEKRGVDPDRAEEAAVEILVKHGVKVEQHEAVQKSDERQEVEVGPETVVAKVDRGVSFGKSLGEAIDDYARGHNVSKSVAADKVILGGQVNEYVRTEKMLRSGSDGEFGQALASRNDYGVQVRPVSVEKGYVGAGKYAEKLHGMAKEMNESDWGKGMSYAQCFDHVATKTDKGKKLYGKMRDAERGVDTGDDSDDDVSKDYSPSDHKGRAGNPSLSGDVLSVTDAADLLVRAAKERLKLDPSMPYVQLINALAREQQWSPELGRKAAARSMEMGRQTGGGYSPGFSGPQPGNIDKRGAMEELQEIAKQLCTADPSLTPEQGFAKAYGDPKNRPIVRREYEERMAARAA